LHVATSLLFATPHLFSLRSTAALAATTHQFPDENKPPAAGAMNPCGDLVEASARLRVRDGHGVTSVYWVAAAALLSNAIVAPSGGFRQ
jgi:hypothetical protein